MHALTGIAVSLLLLLNTLFFVVPLLAFALIKLLPIPPLRDVLSRWIMNIAEAWAAVNKLIFAGCLPTRWEIRGAEALRRDRSYLVICNHQSWVDIPALIETFNRKVPYFKFFLKKELIWVPFLGLAWWGLDYPFMKRYTKAQLARRPELKGTDLEITRRACAKFRRQPVTVVNYLEGTRFTRAKHAEQQSPYRYLLKPKAGGMAFVLAAMGDQLDTLLDVTLVYPDGRVPGFWDLLSGRVSRVIVDIRTRPLEPIQWQGDYSEDPAFRERFQAWVSTLWAEKDQRIEALRHKDS